jgi:hypothetical protein
MDLVYCPAIMCFAVIGLLHGMHMGSRTAEVRLNVLHGAVCDAHRHMSEILLVYVLFQPGSSDALGLDVTIVDVCPLSSQESVTRVVGDL